MDPVEKAAILHEALPYIRRFRQRTFVIKYGGHAMVDDALKEGFARDVCLLRTVGIPIVVVHGGGPQINSLLARTGIRSTFADGMRVTDDETMEVVEMVLSGAVNRDIVGLISKHGGRAVGLSGRDDAFMVAEKRGPVTVPGPSGEPTQVDLGRVGRVRRAAPELIRGLLTAGFIPVVAPVAVDAEGQPLNVNADEAAAVVAGAIGAAKLVLMTDVSGVQDEQSHLLGSLHAPHAERLIAEGVIRGGMIPKVRFALDAVAQGVEKVHIIDGRLRHGLLLEIFTDAGVGTEIRAEQAP